MKIEWIFFDLGSTLTDESAFMEYLFGRVYESLETQGVETTWEVFQNNLQRIVKERKYGGGVHNALKALIRFFIKEKETAERIMEEYTGNVNLDLKYLELTTLHPETILVLREVNKMYSLGLIANQPEGARETLRRLGVLKYFKIIALSNELGCRKPGQDIFLYALKKAGCPASKALMIGDRLDTDIAPAKLIGMRTVRVKRGMAAPQEPSNELEKPDYEVDTLEDLPELLNAIGS